MPRLGIDCRFSASLGGLGTYTRSVVTALLQTPLPCSVTLFVRDESEAWLRDLSGRCEIVSADFQPYSVAEQTAFPNRIQDASLDLMYFPHFNVPLTVSTPFVCTVHDLILHRFPNEASLLKRIGYRFVLRHALKRASAITAVSTWTKDDIEKFYGPRIGANVSVVEPGVDSSFVRPSEDVTMRLCQKHRLDSPFFVYVGNAKEHKNVEGLIAAFQKADLPDTDLVLVTGGKEAAGLSSAPGVRFLPDVSEAELPALYAASIACVTATKMEGFCLPLLEAMACGTSVIAPNVGPIPEVTGGLIELYHDEAELPEYLRVARSSKPDQKRLQSAKRHAQSFTWQKTAEKLAIVLNSAFPD